MTRSNRALLLLSGIAFAVTAGCRGGGGPPATGPSGVPFASVTSRPLAAGDTFAYAGSTEQHFVFAGVSPSPASDTTYAVAQNVSVTGPTAFANASDAFDFKTSETDTSPLQQIGIASDTYYGTSGSDYVTFGSATTDTFGESIRIAFAEPHIVDRLPEKLGDAWTNSGAETLAETSPGGQTSQRTYAADGSYTDTTNYPQGSLYPANVGALTATIAQNPDGSGSYVVAQGGANVAAIAIGTPRPAPSGPPVIPIVQTQGTAPGTEVDVPSWYPSPLALYAESDRNAGGSTFPAACNVPASFGATGNAIVQTIARVDTVLGTLEKTTTTNYVIPKNGVACVTIADSLDFYYDYSGQSPGSPTVSGTPLETKTVAMTLGLKTAAVQPASVRRGTAFALSSLRIADARANLLAFVEHEKIGYRQRIAAALVRARAERMIR